MPDPVNGTISIPLALASSSANSSAPASPTNACGFGTVMACVLSNSTAESYTTLQIVCTVPPGVGTGWRAFIRGFWTPLVVSGAQVGYAAPTVAAVAPSVIPTAGGLLNVTGSHFGWRACADPALPFAVQLLLTQPPGEPSQAVYDADMDAWRTTYPLSVAYQACEVVVWTDTWISCAAPPALDPDVTLRVVVGGQPVTVAGLAGFAGPVVQGVTYAQPPRTRGGDRVTLLGSDFPVTPWPLVVLVGGAVCAVVEDGRTSTSVTCTMPRGAGRSSLALRPLVGVSVQLPNSSIMYAGPVLGTVATPQGRPLEGRFPVIVTGEVWHGAVSWRLFRTPAWRIPFLSPCGCLKEV